MDKSIVRHNLLSGALVIVLGLSFAYLSSRLNFGTLRQMGSGFVPTILSWSLVAIGTFLIVRARFDDEEPDHWPALRPLVIVCIAPLTFGLLLRIIGLPATVVMTALFARLAMSERPRLIDIVAAVALAVFCSFTFVTFLGQSLPIWP